MSVCAQVDGRQVVAHAARIVACLVVSHPQLSQIANAPALDALVVQKRARVRVSRHNAHRIPASAQVDGRQAVPHLVRLVPTILLVAHAQLPVAVAAPALEAAVVQDRTRAERPCCDAQRVASFSEVDRRERVAHLVLTVAPILAVSESQLPLAVGPPALDGAVVQKRARVLPPGREADCMAASSQVDFRQFLTHVVSRVSARLPVPQPQLPLAVGTPALDAPAVPQRAGCLGARRLLGQLGHDLGRRHVAAALVPSAKLHRHLRQAVTHVALSAALVSALATAQLPPAVLAPALESDVVEQRAREVASGRQAQVTQLRPQLDCRKLVSHLVRSVAALGRVPESQLSHVVTAPALHAVVVKTRARVDIPEHDADSTPLCPQIDGRQHVPHLVRHVPSPLRVAHAQLPVAVPAPALEAAVVQDRTRAVGESTPDAHRMPACAQVDGR
eukprot:924283-Rhodomonas_salina.1